jgi:hypothetical protein
MECDRRPEVAVAEVQGREEDAAHGDDRDAQRGGAPVGRVGDAEEGAADRHRQYASHPLVQGPERERPVTHLLLEADEQDDDREDHRLGDTGTARQGEHVHPHGREGRGVHRDGPGPQRQALGETAAQAGEAEQRALLQAAALHPAKDREKHQDINDGHQDTPLDGPLDLPSRQPHHPVHEEAEEPGKAHGHRQAPRPEAGEEEGPDHVGCPTRAPGRHFPPRSER